MKVAHQVALYFVVVVVLVLTGMGIMLNRVYAINVAHQRLAQEWKELQLSMNLSFEVDELIRLTDLSSGHPLLDIAFMERTKSLAAVLEQVRDNSTKVENFEEEKHVLTEETEFLDVYEDFDKFLMTISSLKAGKEGTDEATKERILAELNDLRVSGRKLQDIYIKSMGDASAYAQRAREQILYRTIVVFVVVLVLLGIAAGWFIYLINKNTRTLVEREKGIVIGLLAQSLAHEIRNPLSIIKSSTSVIRRKLPEDSEEYEIAGYLTDEVDRIDQLIEQLLQFRKESKMEMKLQDPVLIIEQVRLLLGGVCERKSLVIDFVNKAEGAQALCDSSQIKQALINVILNAVQASRAGDHIEIIAETAARMYYIHVRDHGPGFKKDVLKKAYDPFYTTKDNGLGLGLFIVKNIIGSHGGSIQIHSAHPHGTRVTIGLRLNG